MSRRAAAGATDAPTDPNVVWVATANRHKAREIGQMVGDMVTVRTLLDLPDPPEIEETGETFLDNARIKARALWQRTGGVVLADDSGLEVDALGGRPGVHSNRYGGVPGDYPRNNAKLLAELAQVEPARRTARFRCVILLIDATGREHAFEGTLAGTIVEAAAGAGGFGYDPLFWLPDRACTVAQLPDHEKNAISHRGRALQQALAFLRGPHPVPASAT